MTKLAQQENQLPLLGLYEHMHNRAVQPQQLLQEEHLSSQTLQSSSKPVKFRGTVYRFTHFSIKQNSK
uniref:Proteasome activator subunit 4 n=1 Tax=Rhizophora mucronata TaxID=61149 RepID=A0A2P2M9G9_RHIMU